VLTSIGRIDIAVILSISNVGEATELETHLTTLLLADFRQSSLILWQARSVCFKYCRT
jgi:hypothetical protein